MKLTDEIEAEYRLREIAEQMAELAKIKESLHQRVVLGVAPPVEAAR
jgi:hypothetical protein